MLNIIKKGARRTTFHLFHGKVETLGFELDQWAWANGSPLLDFFVKKG